MQLCFRNIEKTYSGASRPVAALRDVSFELAGGQFVAVQGPSGCGKSTLLLIAGGLLRPDGGQVVCDDRNVYDLSPEQRAEFRAGHIGFVFQQFHLVPYLTVLDNVLAAALAGANGDPKSLRDRAAQLIDRFGLTQRSDHVPAALSTGERQRAALARALLNEPQILLADEPTGNLDEENSEIVLRHLSEFAADGGAVLLVTHDRQAAEHAPVKITMSDGTIVDGP